MRGPSFSLFFAILIAGVMLFARLGDLPLRDPDEGRNTEVAREMQAAGSWLTPTYNGIVCLDKPAFFFKTVGISMSLFGESEAAARLPSALFALGILAMVFGFCRREYDLRTAALAVMVVATTPLFFALGRHVISDMTLGFFVCGAIFSGYFAETAEGAKRAWLYRLGAAMAGVATLVKGPVGFLLPILTLGALNILEKRAGWWKRVFHPLNFLIFLGVTLPWFIGVSQLHPDYPRYGLLEESFRRYTTGAFRRTGPIYYYALVILGGIFAWSILLPGAAKAAWQAREKWSRADKLLIVWAIVVVTFFSLSRSKLPTYILTALVALAILTARLFARAFENTAGKAASVVFRSLGPLIAVTLLLGIFLLINIWFPDAHRTVFHIRGNEFSRVALTFPRATALLLLVAGVATAAWRLRDMRIAFATFLVVPLWMITFGFGALMDYSEASSTRLLVERIDAAAPKTEVACLESFANGLPFYLKRPVTVISASGREFSSNYIVYTLNRTGQWPPTLVPLAERDRWLDSRAQPVYLIGTDRVRTQLECIARDRGREITQLTPRWWGVLLPPNPYGPALSAQTR